MSEPVCRLYLITPTPIVNLDAFAEDLARTLDADDAAALQIRLKDIADDDVCRVAERLRPIAQSRGVAVVLNDRPDLAARTGCDGVHIGPTDAPYAEARRIVGPDAIVGVTCRNSRHLAMEAAEAGADYVAFGAFFPSRTKTVETRAEAEILSWWQETMTTPCVAIGGITPANAGDLIAAGADFLAVCSGIWSWPQGPEDAVRRFNALMKQPGTPFS